MDQLIFATNNQHKVEEIKSCINDLFNVVSLKEAGINIDISEPYDTLEANATTKCKTIHELTGKNCFSEDTGLEVEALNGAPGVRSARYAGDQNDPNENIRKLLSELKDASNRKARFRTIISLILNGVETQFEGICPGTIQTQTRGEHGFGYDSIFVPEGETRTFAEMDMKEKTRYSHRTKAVAQLLAFLSVYGKK